MFPRQKEGNVVSPFLLLSPVPSFIYSVISLSSCLLAHAWATSMLGNLFSDFLTKAANINSSMKQWGVGPKDAMLITAPAPEKSPWWISRAQPTQSMVVHTFIQNLVSAYKVEDNNLTDLGTGDISQAPISISGSFLYMSVEESYKHPCKLWPEPLLVARHFLREHTQEKAPSWPARWSESSGKTGT